jgi:S-adenosylmethionine:tRNA ribosyltransferase-isomerase
VIRARLLGHKLDAGGRVEVLVERIVDPVCALAMMRASKTPRAGTRLAFGDDAATVEARRDDLFLLRFDAPVLEVLGRTGSMPLPPYIAHAADSRDDERYQTVYAREPGAVAAPTAGLHFDDALFGRLADCGIQRAFVTLHVGAGTFQPVRSDDITRHRMHSERYVIPGTDLGRDQQDARRPAAASWRWAPHRCAPWNPAHATTVPWPRAAARRICSSPRATASAASIC